MAESQTITGTIGTFKPASQSALAIARGHISIFYPALIILDIYAIAWALLLALGYGGMPIIKVMAIVCFVVVPMLFVYALIRFLTVSVIVTRHKILLRRGWPFMGVCAIAREDFNHAQADFSYFGKMLGAGALSITTTDGRYYRVKDISSPDKMAGRLNASATAAEARSTGKAWTTYRIGPGVVSSKGQQVTNASLSPDASGSIPEAEASTTSI